MYKEFSPHELHPARAELVSRVTKADRRMEQHVQAVWYNGQQVPRLPSRAPTKNATLQYKVDLDVSDCLHIAHMFSAGQVNTVYTVSARHCASSSEALEGAPCERLDTLKDSTCREENIPEQQL